MHSFKKAKNDKALAKLLLMNSLDLSKVNNFKEILKLNKTTTHFISLQPIKYQDPNEQNE